MDALDNRKLYRGGYTPEQRFWAKVDKTETCWLWTGSGRRYGHLNVDSKLVRAHRFAWALANGPIPEGLNICHSCDRGFCVNPDHLFLGTQKENVQDMHDKGRYRGGWSRAAQSKGLAVTNSTPVECPSCQSVIGNIGALSTHMKSHANSLSA